MLFFLFIMFNYFLNASAGSSFNKLILDINAITNIITNADRIAIITCGKDTANAIPNSDIAPNNTATRRQLIRPVISDKNRFSTRIIAFIPLLLYPNAISKPTSLLLVDCILTSNTAAMKIAIATISIEITVNNLEMLLKLSTNDST